MSWDFGDGFDFWSTLADGIAPNNWFTGANATTSAVITRFDVGRAVSIGNGGYLYRVLSGNRTVMFFNFGNYYNSSIVPPGQGTIQYYINLLDVSTAQCSITFFNDGSIKLMSAINGGGSVLATYTNAFSGFQWNHFQIKVTINNTTGSIHIRKDGATSDSFSATGLNTRNGTANNYINQFDIVNRNALQVVPTVLDDFYCFTGDDATAPADFQGDVRAFQVMPNGNSTPLQFTPSTGTNWSAVAKLVPAATPNVADATVGHKDLYTVTPLPYTPNSIVCVVGKMFSHKSDTTPFTVQLDVKSVSTVVSSPTLALASTNQWCLKPMAVDPATSAAWLPAAVNAALLGPEVVSSP
jgi:hypothetical protein